MAQQLRVFAAFPENPVLGPAQMSGGSFITQILDFLIASMASTGNLTHVTYTYIITDT